jgi:hypothetical protein
MGAILDYSSGCGPSWTFATVRPQAKLFTLAAQRRREKQRKAGLAENLSIGRNYTIALKLLTAMTI